MKFRPALKTLFCFVLLLHSGLIQAQNKFKLSYLLKNIDEVEILGGPSWVTLREVGEAENIDVKIGYSAGLLATWNLTHRASIVAGLMIEMKGLNTNYESTDYDPINDSSIAVTGKDKLNLNYFTLPFLYQFSPASKRFSLAIGPYISYKYKEVRINEDSRRGYSKRVVEDGYKKWDWGGYLKVTYKVPLSKKVLLGVLTDCAYEFFNISNSSPNSTGHVTKT